MSKIDYRVVHPADSDADPQGGASGRRILAQVLHRVPDERRGEGAARRGNRTPRFILGQNNKIILTPHQWQCRLAGEEVAQDRGSDRDEGLKRFPPASLAGSVACQGRGRHGGLWIHIGPVERSHGEMELVWSLRRLPGWAASRDGRRRCRAFASSKRRRPPPRAPARRWCSSVDDQSEPCKTWQQPVAADVRRLPRLQDDRRCATVNAPTAKAHAAARQPGPPT